MGQDQKIKLRSLIPEVRAPKLELIDRPLAEEDALTRFITGLESGLGTPVNSEGGGFAGLAGETLGMGPGLPMAAVAAISPKMAKELGRRLVDSISDPRVRATFEKLYQRYPRVMGHVDRIETTPGLIKSDISDTGALGVAGSSRGRQNALADNYDEFPRLKSDGTDESADAMWAQIGDAKRMEARDQKYSGIGIDATVSDSQLDSTAAHELAHVAQRILRPKTFDRDYDNFQMSRGYVNNPFEVDARKAGDRWQLEKLAEHIGATPETAKKATRRSIVESIKEKKTRKLNAAKDEDELRAFFNAPEPMGRQGSDKFDLVTPEEELLKRFLEGGEGSLAEFAPVTVTGTPSRGGRTPKEVPQGPRPTVEEMAKKQKAKLRKPNGK